MVKCTSKTANGYRCSRLAQRGGRRCWQHCKHQRGGQQQNNYYNFPLTHYWIASSHNTYLIEDQLVGPADYCGYILFLDTFKGGCLEIDPGYVKQRGNEYDVTVTHTMSQTGSIWLSDLLSQIKNWILNNQNTAIGPVILSFDNKKIKKAEHHRVIWNVLDRYLNISNDGSSYCYQSKNCSWYLDPATLSNKHLNSLTVKDLTGKIIIKWAECLQIDPKKGTCADPKAGKGLLPHPQYWQQGSQIFQNIPPYIHMPASKRCKLHAELCQDPNVMGEVKSTHKAYKYHNINPRIIANTINNFIRVYPNPMEIAKTKSGNYSQIGSWLNGAQLVALNTQKQDRFWVVNRVMFRNTPCRLKPNWMRDINYLQTQELPALRNLILVFGSQAGLDLRNLKVYHPSGETKKPERITNNRVDLFDVNPTLCLIYIEFGNFVGAIEIPWEEQELSGKIETELIHWFRPKKKGIEYMGPNCNYQEVGRSPIAVDYAWSS